MSKKIWIVFATCETYLDGEMVIPKVFTSNQEACFYWERMNLKITDQYKNEEKKGERFRPGRPEYLRITEQDLIM